MIPGFQWRLALEATYGAILPTTEARAERMNPCLAKREPGWTRR